LNLVGRPCTLRPFSTDGIALPRKVDMAVVARAFHNAVEDELRRAGMGVRLAGPKDANEQIVVSGSFVKVTPGNRWKRYFAPFLAGAPAIVEVKGLVTHQKIPLEELRGMGKRGLGPLGGASMDMLRAAAETAGIQLARQAVETLAD
jgi:Domain of unknown function (DUF4410)